MKKIGTLLFSLTALTLYVVFLQAGYFLWAFQNEPRIEQANAVVVYPQSKNRVQAGLWLLRAGYADRFCLLGKSVQRTLHRGQGYGLQIPADRIILSGPTRSTFEDALRTKQLARRKGYERVLVVTSGYHKPRSLLMTRCVFFGSGIRADVLSADRILGDSRSGQAIGFRAWREEFVSLWGSLVELGYHAFSGRLIRDLPI